MEGSHKKSESVSSKSTFKDRKPELVALRERQRNRNRAVAALGVLVALATTLALMVPAITMAHGDLICGMEEHEHSDACYERVLVCTQEEGENHTHSDACYENQLTCGMDAHTHTDACYADPEPEPEPEPAAEPEPPAEPEPAAEPASQPEPAAEQLPDLLANGDANDSGADAGNADELSDLLADRSADDSDLKLSDTNQQSNEQPDLQAGDVADVDADAATQSDSAEDADSKIDFPAQTFIADLIERDGNKEKTVLTVAVDAPEGALPAGATMSIEGVDADILADEITAAISYDADLKNKAQAGRTAAVDISFADAEGNAVEPAEDVEVKIWSKYAFEFSSTESEQEEQTVDSVDAETVEISDAEAEAATVRFEKPVLVHVLDAKKAKEAGKLDAHGSPMKAEIMSNAVLANWDEEDDSEGYEDTFKFKGDEFGTFAITELRAVEAAGGSASDETPDAEGAAAASYPAQQFSGELKDKDGNVTLTVDVDAPEGALPAGAYMTIESVDADKFADDIEAAISYDADLKDKAQAGRSAAVDISFADAEGNAVEPAEDVEVKIWSTYALEYSSAEPAQEEQVQDSADAVTAEGAGAEPEAVEDTSAKAAETEDAAAANDTIEGSGVEAAITEDAGVEVEAIEGAGVGSKAEAAEDAGVKVAVAEANAAETPAVEAETSPVRFEKPVLVHVLDAKKAKETGKLDAHGSPMKAEIMSNAVLANWDEEDGSEGYEDTFKFKGDEFGTFAITELRAVEAAGGSASDEAPDAEGAAAASYPAQQLSGELKDKDGNVTLTVDVDAPEGALPENATMQLTPVTKESVLNAVKDAAAAETDIDAKRAEAIAVDITFFDVDGKMVEPLSDVRVVMTAPAIAQAAGEEVVDGEEDEDSKEAEGKADAKGQDDQTATAPTSLAVVHVADDETTEVMRDASIDTAMATAEFDSAEFSIYAIVYTVDFHYDVDGKTIDYSIPGGSAISLKTLLPIMEICTQEEAEEFVAEGIESVEFSNTSLLVPARVEQSTTLKALKQSLHLAGEDLDEVGDLEPQEVLQNSETIDAVDWVLISLRPFGTEETLTITMKDGEIFTLRVTDLRDPLGIEDRTFAIVSEYNGVARALMSDQRSAWNSEGEWHYLNGTSVTCTPKNSVVYCGKGARAWLFEYDETAQAYRVSDGYNSQDVKYLHYNSGTDASGNGYWDMVSGEDNATLIQVERDADGSVHLSDGNGHYLVRDGGGNNVGDNDDNFSVGSKGDTSKLTLCIPDSADSNAAHKATMTSAVDLQEGQVVVIYQKIRQSDNTYKYYAIDGNGLAQEVTNSSDSVYWRGDLTLEWKLAEAKDNNGDPTGYFYFYNETTDKYLAPKGDGSVVQSLAGYDGDMNDVSISLPGRKAGDYSSRVANWDYDRSVTSGLEVVDNNGSIGVGAVDLLESQDFCFAVRDPVVQGQLTEVDTLDSDSMGIKITMYDFDGSGRDGRLYYQNNQIGSQGWSERVYTPGIMKKVLVDGWPVSVNTGQSLNTVFNPTGQNDNYYRLVRKEENANHLFIENVYESTGYFRYSAFENYAYLPAGSNNFKVYEQIGSPARQGDSDYNNYYMKRGNFFPYNNLDITTVRQNTTNPNNSGDLDDSHPRKNEDLYATDGKNYFFGMTMEAKFEQGPEGLNERGDPMRFDFNGDDDMWIYIDNVLILDIGGVHDAFHGYIDFTSGVIHVDKQDTNTNDADTTIKQRFKDAGIFPDQTPWDDSRVDEYFDGDTFKDYSTHNMKMFYMERGAGASNLQMQFNLPVLTGDQFRVTKEMPESETGGAILSDYASSQFLYHAYVNDENGLRDVTQSEFGSTATYDDGTPLVWYDSTSFVLKPGQTAIFPVSSSMTRYYVEEFEPANVHVHLLDSYVVENSDPANDQAATAQLVTTEKTVQQRGQVFFRNKPKEHMVNELQITKQLTGKMYRDSQGNLIPATETNSPYFEYKVYLEKTDGTLVPYSLGEYYQIDANGKYVYFVNGKRQTMDFNVAENAQGGKTYYYGGSSQGESKPRITEHTSENGSIGDIRPGDTIYITGLLVGTDFAVFERIDRSNIAEEGKTTADGKNEKTYIYEGTETTDAYIRATGENQPDYMNEAGGLYDAPSNLNSLGLDPRTAIGTIVSGMDAKVLVKNKTVVENIPLIVEKNWEGIAANSDLLNNTQIKVTLGRYVLKDKAGALTIKKTGVDGAPFAATYIVKKGDTSVAEIAYSPNLANGKTIYVAPGDYTVTEKIVYQDPAYEWNHNPDSTVEDPAVQSVTIADDGSETVTFSCNPEAKTGSLTITSTLDPGDSNVDFSGVTYTVYNSKGIQVGESYSYNDVVNGLTINDLVVGEYTVVESNVPTVDGFTVTSNPANHEAVVTVEENGNAQAAFSNTFMPSAEPVTIIVRWRGNTYGQWTQLLSSVGEYYVGDTIVLSYYRQTHNPNLQLWVNDTQIPLEVGSWQSSTPQPETQEITLESSNVTISFDNDTWGDMNPSSGRQVSISPASRSVSTRTLSAKAPMKAASDGNAGNTRSTNNTDYGKVPEPAEGKKYVVDATFTNEEQGQQVPYTVVLEPSNYDADTGTWKWENANLPATDADGNLYYYYIQSVEEVNPLDATTVTVKLENNGDQFLVGQDLHMTVDNTTTPPTMTPDPLEVYNEVKGSLKIQKSVTVNGDPVSNSTLALFNALVDDTYTFTVAGKAGTATANETPQTATITISNGVASITEVEDLTPGQYIVTEATPENGALLVGNNGIEVTVEAGKIGDNVNTTTGLASFTNNIDTTSLEVQKVWTDAATVTHSETIEYKIYRIPYRMVDDVNNPGEQTRVEYSTQEVTAQLVPTMTGFTGQLKNDNNWMETIEQLPKTGTVQDDGETIHVSYEYYVTEETVIEGYKTLISGGETEEGGYSYTITNEPLGPTDQETKLDVKKVWNKADGAEDNGLHKNDTVVFNVTQKKYVARVTYQDGGQTVSNVLYPISVVLKDERGTPGSGHVTNEEISTVVYVPAGAEFNITPIEANPNGVTNPVDHYVEGYGFGPGAASVNHRSGVTYTIPHVNSAIEITLDLHAGNDRWYASLDPNEQDYHKWTYTMNSPQGIIWHLEELQEKVFENATQAGSDPEMVENYPITFDYTMMLTNSESGLPTIIDNGTNAPGHGAGSVTETWEGSITHLPLYEYRENAQGVGGTSYIYTYEVAEAAVGSEAVGNTQNPPENWMGETDTYLVKWAQDTDKTSPTYGLWTLTNQKKPVISVTIHKVDANNLAAGTPLLSGAQFKLVKYDLANEGNDPHWSKDTEWGTDGEKEIGEDPQNPGVFSFAGLTLGYYEIVETQFPDGYMKPTENPMFQVRANPSTHEMEAVLVYASGSNMGQPITGNATDLITISNATDNATVTYGNTAGNELPMTGGIGTTPLTIVGGVMVAFAAAILIFRRRFRLAQAGAHVCRAGRKGGLR